MEAPIPQPRLDDDEDVHWALSTAVALWGRGEQVEALKWLRRAAEQASDVNADKRALELFKAAADVANHVKTMSAAPPPPVEPARADAPRLSAPPAPPPRQPSLPRAPQNSGSAFPPPRPPSVPAPPHASPAPPPAIPRAPAAPTPTRSVPPPVPGSAPKPPARPVAPAVTAPAHPIAITAAKPAPQALTPKRRRSFTGEPRPADRARPAEPAHEGKPLVAAGRARANGQEAPHKPHRRRTHTDDDLNVPTRVNPRPPAHAIENAKPAAPSIWDDPDEDTRVISNKTRGDELEQALTRLRATPAPQGTDPRRSTPTPGPVTPAPPMAHADPPRPSEAAKPAAIIAEESTSDGPGVAPASSRTAPSGATERPPPLVAIAPPPPKRLDTLPALRVAVLATGIAGEVRLISLDAGDEPPPGAAVAVLVPMSAADGEAVARLFGTTD